MNVILRFRYSHETPDKNLSPMFSKRIVANNLNLDVGIVTGAERLYFRNLSKEKKK